jgi:hypothetical protein
MVSKNVTSSDLKKMHASVIVAQRENDDKPNQTSLKEIGLLLAAQCTKTCKQAVHNIYIMSQG